MVHCMIINVLKFFSNLDNLDESYVEMHPADHSTLKEMANNDDEEDNLYWNEDPDDPIYIEMNPDVYIPAPDPAELHYASKNLLKERPDLQATKVSCCLATDTP